MKKILVLVLLMLLLTGCSSKDAKEYGENLKTIADEILENSADAEELLNGYSKIWSFSIESGSAISVENVSAEMALDEDVIRGYFELNSIGNVPGDFSSNVNSLNSYYRASGKLDKVEKLSTEIKNKISDLNNPPSDYEKAFDEVLDMYAYSQEYTEMALNPTGSLQSFNENKSKLSSDILEKYRKIEALTPDEK